MYNILTRTNIFVTIKRKRGVVYGAHEAQNGPFS